MKRIFTQLLYRADKGEDLVLSVIIREDGSSPRGTGSIMLTGPNGLLEGTIGGGAIEKDAIETALSLSGKELPCVKEYILHPNDEQDLGMVCGGDVSVLFVPIKSGDGKWRDIASAVISSYDEKKPHWLILDTAAPRASLSDGNSVVAGDTFEAPELADGCVLKDNVFTLPVSPCERAVIFGGGHCCKALVPVLKSVGFSVTVMDCREEFVTPQMHPMADELICGDFNRIEDYIDISPDDYCIVMTNGHSFDLVVEKQLLLRPTAYLGVIGSKSKIASVNARLMEAGIPEDKLSTVHTPIGLSIKAVTPEEIAISITAELILERALKKEEAGTLTRSCPMH